MMNFRNSKYFGQNSYYENNPKLQRSSVSKGFPLTSRHRDQNIGEIEYMLQNQRKKYRQTKQRFEHDLDNQRKLRIQFENKLIKLKDQFTRRDVQFSQMEFKMNNLITQNQDLCFENDRLKSQLMRLQQIYCGKIRQLENQLSMEARNFQQTTNQYNSQFQRFKKQGQDYVQQLTFEYDRKIKTLEQKCKIAQNHNKELSFQNKKLNDILVNNKLAFQQQLRDLKNKTRQEQIKKSQYLNKAFQSKAKVLEEGKEQIIRKNQQLLRALQQKDKIINDLQSKKRIQNQSYRQDNRQMNQQVANLNYLVSKLKNEISEKDELLGRANNNMKEECEFLKRDLCIKKDEIMRLMNDNRQMNRTKNDIQMNNSRILKQLSERNKLLEMESRKYKQENQRIVQILKSKINDTINTVSYKK